MLKSIQVKQAYRILESLVNDYLRKNRIAKKLDDTGDIIMLCSDMSINDKNETADPAIWYDWMESIDNINVQTVLKEFIDPKYGEVQYYNVVEGEREENLPDKKFVIKEAYNAATRFLQIYANRLESKDIKEFIKYLTFEKWQKAIEEVVNKEKSNNAK